MENISLGSPEVPPRPFPQKKWDQCGKRYNPARLTREHVLLGKKRRCLMANNSATVRHGAGCRNTNHLPIERRFCINEKGVTTCSSAQQFPASVTDMINNNLELCVKIKNALRLALAFCNTAKNSTDNPNKLKKLIFDNELTSSLSKHLSNHISELYVELNETEQEISKLQLEAARLLNERANILKSKSPATNELYLKYIAYETAGQLAFKPKNN